MSEENTGNKPERTFSESEMLTLAADRVTRETAELTGKVTELEAANTELQNKLDVAEAAKVAAETKAQETQTAFDEFKAQIEGEREAAAKRDERVSQLREAASHLSDKFFEDEDRVARIVAMSDETFAGYLSDIKETTSGAGTSGNSGGAPRETAMSGDPVPGKPKTAQAASNYLMRRHLAPVEEGATA